MQQFTVRGFEFNEPTHWEWKRVLAAIDYMEAVGYNTLIFHQNDLLDQVCHFKKYHKPQHEDLRRKQKDNRIIYLQRVIELCKRKGIDFYFEVKELSFEDALTDAHPELYVDKGVIDPMHPLWVDYLETKVDEVFDVLGDAAGIIINISAPESRLKISDAPGADMEAAEQVSRRNARLDGDRIAQFYDGLLRAVHRPLHRRGKTLVVREFAWSRESGDRILRVIDGLPEDVVMGVKITSSDYWPTFPMNPNCHQLKNRRKWVEMDVWGENFAWAVLPIYRMGDYREKLLQAVAGADGSIEGIWCRVNWEAVTCVTAPETANDINCYGMAQVGKDLQREPADIIRAFLRERYGWDADERQTALVCAFWEMTYRYICKTPYVLGHVFTRHSLLPESYEQETWAIYGATRRGMWVDGADQSIAYSAHDLAQSRENLKAVYAEKQEARHLCDAVLERAQAVMAEAGCPEKLRGQLSRGLEGIRLYTDAFCDAACGYFSVRYCREAEWDADVAARAEACIKGLRQTAHRQRAYLDEHPDYPHYIHFFYDEKRALSLADSLECNLKEARENVHRN